MTHIIFRVECTELAEGFRVHVDAGEAGECAVTAPDSGLALLLAATTMHGFMEPDMLEQLFRAPSAPDGPEDRG